MSTLQVSSSRNTERGARIISTLKSVVYELTGIEQDAIDVSANFIETGVDSLMLIQAVQLIEGRLGVKLSVVQLLEELTSIEMLADYIDEQLPPEQTLAPTETAETAETAPASAAEPTPAPTPSAPTPEPAPATAAPVYDLAPPARPADILAPAVPFAQNAYAPPPPPPASPQEGGAEAQTYASPALEQIMAQQLQIMSQQLEMLRGGGQSPVAPRAPAEPHAAQPQAATPAPAREERAAAGAAQPRPANGGAAEAAGAPAVSSKPTAHKITPELFNPYQPTTPGTTSGLTARQQKHLEDFIKRYGERTKGSKQHTQDYRRYLADSRASAGFRLLWKEMVYPIVGNGSRGSRVWDVDGNEYVDLTMGFGLHLFGHSPDFVVEAIERQLKQGIELGPQIYLAGKVSQLVCELGGVERVNICNSGTEAVMGALRIARTVTRRNKIALFGGSYHGWSDGTLGRPLTVGGKVKTVPLAPGVQPQAVEDVLVLDWDNPRSLDILKEHAHELAAVLVEPVQSRRPDIQPREFLHELRRLTEQAGAALIFDEMVTGFRIGNGGAQEFFGVEADLVIYGKVIGAGLPVGIVGGKAAFMDAFDGGMWSYGDASYPRAEKTLFAGAFFKHPLTMAAAWAILNRLKDDPETLPRLNRKTERLVGELNAYFREARLPIHVGQFGSLFRLLYPRELKHMDLFFYHLLDNGVFLWEGRNCFLSASHTDEDLDMVVRAFRKSVEQMREGGFFPEPSGDGGAESDSPPAAAGLSGNTAPAAAHGADAQAPQQQAAAPASVNEVSARPAGAVARATAARTAARGMQFSLYYFGSYESEFSPDKYQLLIEGARFADRHGFAAVWVPERHFYSFGGFSPNPSVVAAAIARETERLQIRAGSVVLPLHNPIRVAEEWSVVDNLSRGRVGVSFASGWHPNDFALAPDSYERRRELMYEGIATVQKLWRGEPVEARSGRGEAISLKLSPMPMQKELPTWVTGANNSSFVKAGEIGARFLTNLSDQSVEELAEKIKLYRDSLSRNGFDPESGHVTVLLHTFLDSDFEEARRKAHDPFLNYLKSSLGLSVKSKGKAGTLDVNNLPPQDMKYILESGYERHLKTGALIGTPESCRAVVERLIESGVDEIGCLIDFGVDTESALEGLTHLDELRARYEPRSGPGGGGEDEPAHVAEAGARRQAYTVPLTEAQRELWIATQLGDDASRAYNESITLRLRGPLDSRAMLAALRQLVERHDALRSTFSPDGDFQIVWTSSPTELPLVDLTQVAEGEREGAAARWVEREIDQVFDIVGGPLVRFHLLKLAEDHHLLHITNHHLILDGQSWGVMMHEFRELYVAGREGASARLPPPVPFREYVSRQADIEQRPEMEGHEAYWLEQFADSVPLLELPKDRPRPPVQTYNGRQLRAKLGAGLSRDLKRVSVEQRSTMLMLLMAAYKVLLHRLSGQDDIVVGIASAGQLSVGEKNIVGYCLNMLPLRSRVGESTTFAEHLSAVRRGMLHGYEHQSYSFGRLIDKLGLRGDPGRPPLFTAAFDFERGGAGAQFHDLTLDVLPKPSVSARFDIHTVVTEAEDGLLVQCNYNTDLFDEETVRRWLGHYETLLQGIVADPRQSVWALPLMSEAQRHELLTAWNSTEAPYPARCLHELVEEQAALTPEATAVVFEGERLSYDELNRNANRLAHHLRAAGVGPDARVGVLMERSAEMVVALLGVLKAGAAYVPLDPEYPADRLDFMLKDAGVSVLLTHQRLDEKLPAHGARVVRLDADREAAEALEDSNPAPSATPDNLAYVIYTSGSTGTPKGVMIQHRAILNRLLWMQDKYPLTAEDRVLQKTTFSFDASVWEFFVPLLAGAQVVLARPGGQQDSAYLVEAVRRHGITVLQLVPTMLRVVLEEEDFKDCTSLRRVYCGGEAFPAELQRRFFALHTAELHNLYGPTETSIDAAHWECERDGKRPVVPIGRPIANTRLYVLDARMNPSPPGVPGELYVGGAGVARGYLNRPGLTAERFVPDPFSEEPGARLYRTGDLVRYGQGGALEYLGRVDHQVKLRGFRVELGEIESALRRHPSVAEAVVTASRQDGRDDARLVAYVVPSEGGGAEEAEALTAELRGHLRQALPEYMVPAAFVTLGEMPLTPNGKLDRKALPPPESESSGQRNDYVAPRNEVEAKVAEIWAELFGVERVGIHDQFLELGGHSLLAIQLISRLRAAFQTKVTLRGLFESPTVAQLAEVIAQGPGAGGEAEPDIRKAEEPEPAQLAEQLDELSDGEVDSLLDEMLAEEEIR
jgi:iturin family lipopeptide synthetase A